MEGGAITTASFNGNGNLEISGGILADGSLSVSVNTIISSTDTIRINNSYLNIRGNVQWDAGHLEFRNSKMTVFENGVLDIQGDVDTSVVRYSWGAFLLAGGTIKKTAGVGDASLSFNTFRSQGGTFNVQSGGLIIRGSSRVDGSNGVDGTIVPNTGTLTVLGQGLQFASRSQVFSPDSEIVGDGELTIAGSSFSGSINLDSTIRMMSGSISNATFNNGVNSTGMLLIEGGSFTGNNSFSVDTRISSPETLRVQDGSINFNGDVIWDAVHFEFRNSKMIVSDNGVLDIQGDVSTSVVRYSWGAFLLAGGTIKKTAGIGDASLSFNTFRSQGGVINVQSGGLIIRGSSRVDGSNGVDGTIVPNIGTLTVLGQGLQFASRSQVFSPDSEIVGDGELTIAGSSFSGSINLDSTIRMMSGSISNATFNNGVNSTGMLLIEGGSFTGNNSFSVDTRISSPETLRVQDGSINFNGDVIWDAGHLEFRNSKMTVFDNGVLDIQGDVGTSVVRYNWGAFLLAGGTIKKTAGVVDAGLSFNTFRSQGGVIDIQSGGLIIRGSSRVDGSNGVSGTIVPNTGTLTILGSGLEFASGTQSFSHNSTINGDGYLNFNGGSFVLENGININPGFPNGTLTLSNNLSTALLKPNTNTNIEIGGSPASGLYDTLSFNGAATLGGNLNITFKDGYIPTPGDTYPIVNFTSSTNDFSNINGPVGYDYTINNTGTAITITINSLLPGAYFDNQVGDGDWYNPLNWVNNSLPDENTDVFIKNVPNGISINSGITTIKSLTLNSSDLSIEGGELFLTDTSVISSDSNLNISGGNFHIGNSLVVNGQINFSGGYIYGGANGQLRGSGSFDWSGGDYRETLSFYLPLNIEATSIARSLHGTVNIYDRLNWLTSGFSMTNSSVINIQPNATWSISESNGANIQGGASGAINLYGTLEKTSNSHNSIGVVVNTENATVDIQSGSVGFSYGGTHRNNLNIINERLNFSGGTHQLDVNQVFSGDLAVTGGSTYLPDGYTLPTGGILSVDGGNLQLEAELNVDGQFKFQRGNLYGGANGQLRGSGSFDWSGGDYRETLSFYLPLNIEATSIARSLHGTVNIYDRLNWLTSGFSMTNSSVINIQPNATWSISESNGANIQGGASGAINLYGTLEKTSNSHNSIGVVVNTENATVDIQSGSVGFSYGGTHRNNLNIINERLNFSGGTHQLDVNQVFSGDLAVTGGSTYLPDGYTLPTGGILSVDGGNLQLEAELNVDGQFKFQRGNLYGGANGQLRGSGSFDWSGGDYRETLSFYLPLNIEATSIARSLHGTVNIYDRLNWLTSGFSMTNGSVINIQPNATWSISENNGANIQGGASGAINLYGTLEKMSNSHNSIGVVVNTDNATVDIQSGSVGFSYGGTHRNTLTTLGNGLILSGGTPVLADNIELNGTGSLTLSSNAQITNLEINNTLIFAGGTHNLGSTRNFKGSGNVQFTGANVSFTENRTAINVLADTFLADNGPISISNLSQPTNGSASLDSTADNITFDPKGFAGTDSFTYQVNGSVGSAIATVNYNVLDAGASFTAVNGGDWGDAANWSGNQVPSADDVVVLNNITGPISYSAGSSTVSKLYLNNSQLDITGGSLEVSSLTSVDVNSDLNVSTATLKTIGDLSVAGTANFGTGAIVQGSGTTTVETGGTLNIDTSNGMVTFDGISLTNKGTVDWIGNQRINVLNNVYFDNQSQFNLLGDGSIFRDNHDSIFDNSGSLIKSAGGATSQLQSVFNNSGLVKVEIGALEFAHAYAHTANNSGNYEIISPASIIFSSGAKVFDVTSSITGNGDVYVSDSEANFSGTYNITGKTRISSGPAFFNSPSTTGNLELDSNGKLYGASSLTVKNNFDWFSGIQGDVGSTIIDASGLLTIDSLAAKSIDGRNLVNYGAFNWIDGEVGNIVNGSFEQPGAISSALPTGPYYWSGDASSIVTAENGIEILDGSQMLKFLGTNPSGGHPTGTGSELWQLIDLQSFSDAIANNSLRVVLEGYFNRVTGDALTDTNFSVEIRAFAGDPSTFFSQLDVNELEIVTTTLVSDDDSSTWENIQTGMIAPVDTNFLAILIVASENVSNDAVDEFDGHYADLISVTLSLQPDEAPSDINLSQSTVDENSIAGDVIATLSAIDANQNDIHTFTLVDDADGAVWLSGNELQVYDSSLWDYETQSSIDITVRATDNTGLSIDKVITISIVDVDESPIVGEDNETSLSRVSVADDLSEGNDSSFTSQISGDGRYVVFESTATNLDPHFPNPPNPSIYRRDTLTGETELISIDSNGDPIASKYPSINYDGQFISFRENTNSPLATLRRDIVNNKTDIVSINELGVEADDNTYRSAISSDGQIVAFSSDATNLTDTPNVDQIQDIFVRDILNNKTTRVSVDSAGVLADDYSYQPAISADGNFIAFVSDATNLVVNDKNDSADIFIHNRNTKETHRVSVDSTGLETSGYFDGGPAVSADGRFVVFESDADNLVVNDTNYTTDVFRHDTSTGETVRVSLDSHGNETDGCGCYGAYPDISADGRFVTFHATAENMVSGDNNGLVDVFLRDTKLGSTVRLSSNDDISESNNESFYASISADGSKVVFESNANNLVDTDTNDQTDVFLWQRNFNKVLRNSSVVIDVLENDNDPEYGLITLSQVSQGSHGSVSINPDDTLNYTADLYYVGKDEFSYSVSDPAGNISTGHVFVEVVSPGEIEIASDTYTVNESNGSLEITIKRLRGSHGIASVGYYIDDGYVYSGTASADEDFQEISGTLTWADGDVADKIINVPIINDSEVESTEDFMLIINNGSLGSVTETIITIEDDDVDIGPQTIEWNSTTSGDWSDPTNWPNGIVPTAIDHVTIIGDLTDPIIISGDITIASLQLGNDSGSQSLNITGKLTVTENTVIATSASLILNNGTLESNNVDLQGVLTGFGAINGDLVNSGNLFPIAIDPELSVITLRGNYEQTSSGFLNIDIVGNTAGTEHSQLIVEQGRADVNGSLLITSSNDYQPAATDAFSLIVTDGNGDNQLFGEFSFESLLSTAQTQFWQKDFSSGTANYYIEENNTPSDILLSNNNVLELAVNNTLIGSFSVIDPDVTDNHSFELLDNANGRFALLNAELRVADTSLLDYETQDSHIVDVKATDKYGFAVTKEFVINITNVNEPPLNISLSQTVVLENSVANSIIGHLSVIDTDTTDSHSFLLTNNAAGAFALAGNQLVVANSALLDYETSSTKSIVLQVTDAGGLSLEQSFTINLADVDETNTTDDPSQQQVTGKVAFNVGNASGNEDAGEITVTLSRIGGSDGELSIEINSQSTLAIADEDYQLDNEVFTWADGDESDKTLTIRLIDDNIPEATETLELSLAGDQSVLGQKIHYQLTILDDDVIVVNPSAKSDPLLISTTRLPSAQKGVAFETEISVSSGTPPYTIVWTADVPGLEFAGLRIMGTPQVSGDYSVTLEVSDVNSANPTIQTYQFFVATEGLVIPTYSELETKVGADFSQQLEVVGGKGPYIWTVTEDLPDGLTLEKSGLLIGRTRRRGSFTFSASVTDRFGQSSTQTFTLMAQEPGLVNLTPSLPIAQVGVYYKVPILLNGGQEPYQCSIGSTELPPGLSLNNCKLDGIASEAGNFNLLMTAVDSSAVAMTLDVPLTVNILSAAQTQQSAKVEINSSTLEDEIDELSSKSPGESYADEVHTSMTTDAFGNQYLVGHAYNGKSYDIHVIKFNINQTKVWHQVYNSGAHDYVYGVTVSPEQDVYVGGYRLEGNIYKGLLIKYNSIGVIQWQKTYDNSQHVDTFYNLVADNNGVYAVGESYNGSDFDSSIIKYSQNGVVEWKQQIATSDNDTAYALDLAGCSDTQATCALYVAGSQGQETKHGWIVKVSPSNGEILLTHSVPSVPIKSLKINHSEQLIVGGVISPHGWQIMALSENFDELWSYQYRENKAAGLRSIAIDRDNVAYAVGYANNGQNEDALLVAVGPDGTLLDDLRIDKGADERINGVVIDANQRLVISGQRKENNASRFLLIHINYGKALQ